MSDLIDLRCYLRGAIDLINSRQIGDAKACIDEAIDILDKIRGSDE